MWLMGLHEEFAEAVGFIATQRYNTSIQANLKVSVPLELLHITVFNFPTEQPPSILF